MERVGRRREKWEVGVRRTDESVEEREDKAMDGQVEGWEDGGWMDGGWEDECVGGWRVGGWRMDG